MVWYRPAPGEMDAVASAAGDSSWNAKSLEPFLVATERFTKPTAEQIAQGATFVESVHGYKVCDVSDDESIHTQRAVNRDRSTAPSQTRSECRKPLTFTKTLGRPFSANSQAIKIFQLSTFL